MDQHAAWLDELNATWHSTIPLTATMGVKALSFDGETLETGADFDANRNLHGTMFAGSIYTQATLTGWGRVWLALKQQGLDGAIVLAEGQIRYRAPVTDTPRGTCTAASLDLSPLAEGRKASATLTVSLDGKAEFEGRFVVLPCSD